MPGGTGAAGGCIQIVCPNPALDRLQIVETLRVGAVNRAHDVASLAGGKGVIVARGIRRLGGRAALHGFVGGAVGSLIRAGCRDLGVEDHHVEIADDTRITAVVVESSTGASTVVNETGPTVTTDEVGQLLEGVAGALASDQLAVCTGSVPPGAGVDLHARVVRLAGERGARAVVDTHGDALAAAVKAGPWMAKPNLAELSDLLGVGLSTDDLPGVVDAMDALRADGVDTVVVTLGAAGVVLLDDDGPVHVVSPRINVRNATGSGDMLLAGLTRGLVAGLPVVEALRRGVAAGAANAEALEPDIDADRVDALVSAAVAKPIEVGRTGVPR